MKRVYVAESLVDGQLVVIALANVDVPARVVHENAVGALGELPMVHPEVWIERDLDYEKALWTIDRFEQAPDCDLSVTCRRCHEENPASFEICWQCHGGLDAD